MSKKVDKQIQQEYDRIAAGPHTGWFTCLHHAGDFLETSHNVIERLDFILFLIQCGVGLATQRLQEKIAKEKR